MVQYGQPSLATAGLLVFVRDALYKSTFYLLTYFTYLHVKGEDLLIIIIIIIVIHTKPSINNQHAYAAQL